MTAPLHGTRRESEQLDQQVSGYHKIVRPRIPKAWLRILGLVALTALVATVRVLVNRFVGQ